ncbi:MAG: hypothetical protein ACKOE7_02945, partial [Actinomycetota bacterium]
ASLVVSAFIWVVVAGAIGAVLGLERLDAGAALVNADALTQLFSLHRFALVFGVVAPLMLVEGDSTAAVITARLLKMPVSTEVSPSCERDASTDREHGQLARLTNTVHQRGASDAWSN